MRFRFGKRRSRSGDEALVWLARLKRGLRRTEGPELLAWLKRRSHRTAIARAAVEWHEPEVVAVLSEIFPIPPAIREPRCGSRPAFLVAAAFAGACVAIGVPVAILISAGAHRYVYATARNSRKRLTLEDGTRVELNRATRINVTYAEHIRSVSLARGEAVFKVANRPHSPFYVHAAGVNFETRAATFDVRFAAPDRMSLTVLKGTVIALPHPVARSPAGADQRVFRTKLTRPILLEPLQMLVVEHGEESGQALTERDVRSRLAWQGRT